MFYTIKVSLFVNENTSKEPSAPNIVKVKKSTFICTVDSQKSDPSTALEIKEMAKEKLNLYSIESDSLISNSSKATFPESSLITDNIVIYEAIITPTQGKGKSEASTKVVNSALNTIKKNTIKNATLNKTQPISTASKIASKARPGSTGATA